MSKKIVVETLFIGEEPVWGDAKKEISLFRALSWYSNQFGPKESKKYTLDYVKKEKYPKDIVEKLSGSDEDTFKNLGFVCRMISRGATLDRESWIKQRINEIITFVPFSSSIIANATKPTDQKPEKTIQERVFEQATVYINEIEGHVDSFIKERVSTFKCYEWLSSSGVKPIYTSQIKEHYAPLFDELTIALNKSDEQVTESYSHWTKKELTAFLKFVEGIISDCDKYSSNTKTVRKTRKKKAIPAEKKVAKVQYKKEDAEYKIVSINPTEIIAAKQLWVFNSKNKSLGLYNSMDDSGFSIKGTTIVGFDEITSIQKTLRKPEEVLPLVTKGKKTELKKILSGLSTKEKVLNGRLNEEIVILRAIK